MNRRTPKGDIVMLRVALVLASLTSVAIAGPKVTVVVGPDAPQLEKTAAAELAGQLTRLYQAEVATATAVPAQAEHVILVGSPTTNPAIPAEAWPKLSDQGHVVKSLPRDGKPSLVIGGGSPAATYWAVAEHGYRLGIRSFTFGDLDPISPPAFHLDGWDVVMEPRLKVRGFTTLAPDEIGLSMWGLEEQKKLIKQLAKLKFNRIVVYLEPWYPVVDWEYEGAKRSEGWFSLKELLAIDSETLGRAAFKGQKEFDNPDLVGKTTWKERVAAGQSLVRGIVDEAQRHGMEVCLSLRPFGFSAEFEKVLPPTEVQMPDGEPRFCRPAALNATTLNTWLETARAQLEATLHSLPAVTFLELRIPDWATETTTTKVAEADARAALERLQTQSNTTARIDLADLESLAAPIAYLEATTRLFGVPRGTSPASRYALNFVSLTDEGLQQLVPPNAGSVVAISLTPEWISDYRRPPRAGNSVLLLEVGGGRVPSTFQSDMAVHIERLAHYGWDGFQLSVAHPGDAELELHLASRATMLTGVTPRQALRGMVNPVCGDGVSISVEKAFDAAEQSLWSIATNEMYRANTRSREGGRQFTLYLARRFEFSAAYATAVDTVAKAETLTDKDARAAEMEKALDSFHAAGVSMAAMARSSSDRAIIAALNRDSRLKQAREALGE